MLSEAKPTLLIDSREQLPYSFERFSDQFKATQSMKLLCGDYSILGFETKIAFERKSLTDLVNTVIHNRQRFVAELMKLANYDFAAIVVEATLSEVSRPYTFSAASPASVVGSLQSFSLLYGVHVIYAGNRVLAEQYIANTLLKYYKYNRQGEA